jgi:hypothetical protein
MAALSGPVSAQDYDQRLVDRGKAIYATKVTCPFCHGWSGDGDSVPRAPRPKLSLRETELDRESLAEVVQCGRPGTRMPYHDKFAYRDDRCYGMTAAEAGDDLPEAADNSLQKREIAAVVEYLLARIVGRGPITVEECEEYFAPGASNCAKYRGN